MRRFVSALASISLLSAPVSAFAAYETPGQLLQAVQFDSSAKTFKSEVHGNQGTMYIAAWMNGMMQGSTFSDTDFSMNVTVDVEDTANHIKARVKGSLLLKDERLYGKLDTVEGTFEDDAIVGKASFALKRWVELPVDPEMMMDIQKTVHQQSGDPSAADDLYNMQKIPYQYGSSYILTLKPGAISRFAEEAGLPEMVDSLKSIDLKIDTDYKDVIQVSQVNFSVDADGFLLTGMAKTEKMRTALKLTAPVDALSMESLMSRLTSFEMFGNDFSAPSFDSDDEWESDDWSDMEDDTIAPPASEKPARTTIRRTVPRSVAPEPRTGSSITRPSRRAIQQDQSMQNDNKPYSRSAPKQQISTLGNRGLTMGSQSAPITIVQFTDIECPFCLQFSINTMPALMHEYIDTGKVKLVLRHYPLSIHEHAYNAAMSVECSAIQGKDLAWKMYNGLNAAQEDDQTLDDKLIWSVAGSIKGLDMKAFNKCMDTKDTADELLADKEAADKAGLTGTPSFYILSNGGAKVTPLMGAQAMQNFREVLDDLLGE